MWRFFTVYIPKTLFFLCSSTLIYRCSFGLQALESSRVCLQKFCISVEVTRSAWGGNNRLCLLLTGKSMSRAHDAPRSCDTQSLIDRGETKILCLRGPWWEVIMCNAEPVASILLSLFFLERRKGCLDHRHTLICQNYRWEWKNGKEMATDTQIGTPGMETTSSLLDFCGVKVHIGS